MMAYNFTIKLSEELLSLSRSSDDFKKRYMGIVVWTSQNLQKDKDYDFSLGTTYIAYLRGESILWDMPTYLHLNCEEDLLAIRLKFLV